MQIDRMKNFSIMLVHLFCASNNLNAEWLTFRVGSCIESCQQSGVVKETKYMNLCCHDDNQTAELI